MGVEGRECVRELSSRVEEWDGLGESLMDVTELICILGVGGFLKAVPHGLELRFCVSANVTDQRMRRRVVPVFICASVDPHVI